MTPKERFLETMLFGTPDRIPYRFGGPRHSTFEAWYRLGPQTIPLSLASSPERGDRFVRCPNKISP